MSAERKPVQKGVRVKLPEGMTWEKLSMMSPEEIKQKDVFPEGFLPLPHAKHETGGQVIPENHIEEIMNLEKRNLKRFDVEFDLPTHFQPEFPPPIFLTTRPDLGDVSQGKLLSTKNYYDIMHGILTPVQMEGLRLLLTPFPQQQFNQTDDRKVKEPSLGITCLDCHANGQEFDLPTHFQPEFPPPIFLTTRPDLGDVSQGKLLSTKNYYDIMHGILTPVQMEGLRLLLTPFPQQQFNQTDDRKVKEPSLGITCLDCHANGHTNAAFHLNPDTRPHIARLRLDTVSLRGMNNQQIHGSKRSLRSIEDFTEFEQRTAYFDGDHVTAAKKGVNLPDRTSQVSMMAQMQNIFDFPPAPKLTVFGKLDPDMATDQELLGQDVFFGKGKCAACHPAPFYLDDKMHDLKVDRFYEPRMSNGKYITAAGPIKTFTLRGIKDSPPYMHDGRLLTLDDTVEFFNIVTDLKLTQKEKDALVAFMMQL